MKIIGTRGSALALTQSRHVAALLAAAGTPTELRKIVTQGDRVTHLSLDKIEGKGFFTTEIEEALLKGRIDLAVHSLKDLPAEPTPGLVVAAIPEREDCRDTLLIRPEAYAPKAPALPLARGTVVGTSAVRRKAQLLAQRPDLKTYDLRGNVTTRIQKLLDGKVGAILLAQAGLRRLDIALGDGMHTIPLSPEIFVPAPGQGALALQCRSDDVETRRALSALHCAPDAELVQAERGLLARLKAGCHVPLGAHAARDGRDVTLQVFFGGRGQGSGDATAEPPAQFSVAAGSAEAVAELAYAELCAVQPHLIHVLSAQHPDRPEAFVP